MTIPPLSPDELFNLQFIPFPSPDLSSFCTSLGQLHRSLMPSESHWYTQDQDYGGWLNTKESICDHLGAEENQSLSYNLNYSTLNSGQPKS